MGTVTKTIGSGVGRDFSTFSSWAASLPANLVTDGNSYVGEAYADSEFIILTTALTLSGHTTDSSHTITVTTGPGQSFRDNANAQTNALKYNASNGVGIRNSGIYANQTTFSISDSNVTISNLQFDWTGVAHSTAVGHHIAGGTVQLDFCIFDGSCHNVISQTAGSLTITNSLIVIRGGLASNNGVQGHGGVHLYFVTCVCPSDKPSSGSFAFTSTYSPNTCENCAAFGMANTSSSAYTATTCMTDLSTGLPAGWTGGKTYASQFVGVTNAAGDWRIVSGSALIGAGTSDATHGANDIVGTARPQGSNWDIGCWEFLVSAGVASPFYRSRRPPLVLKQPLYARR